MYFVISISAFIGIKNMLLPAMDLWEVVLGREMTNHVCLARAGLSIAHERAVVSIHHVQHVLPVRLEDRAIPRRRREGVCKLIQIPLVRTVSRLLKQSHGLRPNRVKRVDTVESFNLRAQTQRDHHSRTNGTCNSSIVQTAIVKSRRRQQIGLATLWSELWQKWWDKLHVTATRKRARAPLARLTA